ncbi:hypothetical protein BTJ39_18910 [Izhakiella australiensis]|uniref:3-phytase n=1 Tax=Izhakiella australiensis TaxID=1926881 RepID=A0A1S8YG38_9GAMM|nr:histidine-type phosphatase [Izhakiella australiensis]OON38044.1 hypothetical protein BTJ39_18910 [Izhakiella australiensis]
MRQWLSAGLLFLLSAVSAPCLAQSAPQWQLEKVVEIARHGVRPPVSWDRRAIEADTGRSWPRWSTPDGELTQHGRLAATIKGQLEGQHYRRLGLIDKDCPTARDVYIYASPLQRTRATADALSQGAFPGCQLQVHYQQSGNDPLFLTGSQRIPLDGTKAKAAVLQAMGGSVQAAQRRWQPEINRLARALCQQGRPCPLLSTPWALNVNHPGNVSVPALDHQAAAAETLRLAWSEGLPAAQVGFGSVRQQRDLTPLLELNSVKYRYSNDVPYIASRQGSRLLAQIIAALESERPSDVGQRWLLLVAHDNNIAYLRTLLRFHWQQADYPEGNIPPGASLVFERWRDNFSGKRYLRILFRTQRLTQIRHLTPLKSISDLLQTEYSQPGCRHTDAGILCPLDASLQTFSQRLDSEVLQPFSWPSS